MDHSVCFAVTISHAGLYLDMDLHMEPNTGDRSQVYCLEHPRWCPPSYRLHCYLLYGPLILLDLFIVCDRFSLIFNLRWYTFLMIINGLSPSTLEVNWMECEFILYIIEFHCGGSFIRKLTVGRYYLLNCLGNIYFIPDKLDNNPIKLISQNALCL